MICQEYVFIQKKSPSKQKLLRTNKTTQVLWEFYPTTNILLSMSRKGSAIKYHTQGCCKATCKAPSCVPGELPAAAASEHFKASDHWVSESTSPFINTLPLYHYTRQHNRAKHPWHGFMSGCHFCLTLAFPDAYILPQLTLRPTRCCCQHCREELQPDDETKMLKSLPVWCLAQNSLQQGFMSLRRNSTCPDPNSSTNKTESDYSKGSFPLWQV